MGIAWKAFKVFLMVLGSISFSVLSVFVAVYLVNATISYSRMKDCDDRIDLGVCSALIAKSSFLEHVGFDLSNASRTERIGQVSRVTSDRDGRPVVETTYVFFANEPAQFELDGKSISKEETKTKLMIGFEKRIQDTVCSEQRMGGLSGLSGGGDFSTLEQSNGYQSFLKAGGVLVFKIGVTNEDRLLTSILSQSSLLRENTSDLPKVEGQSDNSIAIDSSPYGFETGPVIITSCEDKT